MINKNAREFRTLMRKYRVRAGLSASFMAKEWGISRQLYQHVDKPDDETVYYPNEQRMNIYYKHVMLLLSEREEMEELYHKFIGFKSTANQRAAQKQKGKVKKKCSRYINIRM